MIVYTMTCTKAPCSEVRTWKAVSENDIAEQLQRSGWDRWGTNQICPNCTHVDRLQSEEFRKAPYV